MLQLLLQPGLSSEQQKIVYDILAATDAPPAPVRDITATVCWLAERELQVGARVLVQHGTSVTKAIVKAVESAAVKEKLGKLGVEPMVMKPEDFDARVAKEVVIAEKLAKAAGIAAK